jgi:hypothetical protein
MNCRPRHPRGLSSVVVRRRRRSVDARRPEASSSRASLVRADARAIASERLASDDAIRVARGRNARVVRVSRVHDVDDEFERAR